MRLWKSQKNRKEETLPHSELQGYYPRDIPERVFQEYVLIDISRAWRPMSVYARRAMNTSGSTTRRTLYSASKYIRFSLGYTH